MSASPTSHPQFQFSERDEGPHPATDDPLLQESVLLHWNDREQGIGGWHRIGHEVNNQDGRVSLWSFMFDETGWQYRRCADLPLTTADQFPNGFGAGAALRFVYEDGAAKWLIDDGPLNARLECRNFFPLVDPFAPDDEIAVQRSPHHFEVAGRVTGQVTYKDRTVSIDGYGFRDHSWGARDWENGMLNHRWFTGSLGPELSFAAITGQVQSGKLVRAGFVSRNDETVLARSVDVVAHMEPDGLTHRGGEIRLTLPDDEIVHIRCTARAGVLFQRGTVVIVAMMSDAEGHGLKGHCDAEVSTNPRNGKGPVLLALNANAEDGFSTYEALNFT